MNLVMASRKDLVNHPQTNAMSMENAVNVPCQVTVVALRTLAKMENADAETKVLVTP